VKSCFVAANRPCGHCAIGLGGCQRGHPGRPGSPRVTNPTSLAGANPGRGRNGRCPVRVLDSVHTEIPKACRSPIIRRDGPQCPMSSRAETSKKATVRFRSACVSSDTPTRVACSRSPRLSRCQRSLPMGMVRTTGLAAPRTLRPTQTCAAAGTPHFARRPMSRASPSARDAAF
jgi:hypothetical protein